MEKRRLKKYLPNENKIKTINMNKKQVRSIKIKNVYLCNLLLAGWPTASMTINFEHI